FGVDPEQFSPTTLAEEEPGRDERPFTIGFAGRLVPEKGVDLLVEACAELSVDWRLVILGEGPALAEVQRRIAEHHVEPNVVIRGPVSSAQMPHELRGLDVLV